MIGEGCYAWRLSSAFLGEERGFQMRRGFSRRKFFQCAGKGAALAAVGTFRAVADEGLPLPSSTVVRAGDRYVNPRNVLLWESTRKEIREGFESGKLKAAIVPTGSTEQHNEHLAMIQDTASAVLVAQQAALKLHPQVVVSTPVPVGISPYWMERKGTLTLRPETFLAFVYDICDSLRAHGFMTIFIVNGHGGNDQPLKSHVAEWRDKLGVNVDACSYWDAYTSSEGMKAETSKLMRSGVERVPGHSAEFETSFALAAFPERIHREGVDYEKVRLRLKDPQDAKDDRDYYRESMFATEEKGEALIRIAVDWVAARLQNMMERG
ncbi:MAG: creatininase family protein [Acidobacteria bacterium]|nr:creatininase family protein [Acidobacteriota bacterium]